jgi:hypothetical protein
MIKKEKRQVWALSNKDKKEIIKALPRILGYAMKEGYESISDLFDSEAEGDIIFLLENYIDFIGEEIEYIDVYKGNDYNDYVGDVIINYILKSEKTIHIKPDLTELANDDYALQNFFWNHNLDEIIVDFLKDKSELKKELINFCLR